MSNGGLIHRVGSLTKTPNGSDHDEHIRRGDNMRSSVNHHHSRRPSVKNSMLDHAHKRPSYYKHGRYKLVPVSMSISVPANSDGAEGRSITQTVSA